MNDFIRSTEPGRLPDDIVSRFNGRPYIVVGAIIAAACLIFSAVMIAVFS